MRIIPDVEQQIRRAIRDERAKDPIITVVGLQKRLEENLGKNYSREYLTKLLHKVSREPLVDVSRAEIEPRLAAMRENYRVLRERLLKIIYWRVADHPPGTKPPLNRDVIEACKVVANMDQILLQAEAAAGLYKKPIAEVAKEFRYDPLPPEMRMVIMAAWQRGGLLPAPVIEEMVPEEVVLESKPLLQDERSRDANAEVIERNISAGSR